jgi:hypothetical protein
MHIMSSDGPVRVRLVNRGARPVAVMAKYAADQCYRAEPPEFRDEGDPTVGPFVADNLMWTGHHTTLQHQGFTFQIEGIAVGDVTLGLHLTHPFYATDQRSGRFCSKMFSSSFEQEAAGYVGFFYPELGDAMQRRVMDYLQHCLEAYRGMIDPAIGVARRFIGEDRPHWLRQRTISRQKFNVDVYAPKIAQEQLRAVLPVMAPTGLVYTINFSVLVAMWEAAFTPVLAYVTERMRQEVAALHPDVASFFRPERRRAGAWTVPWPAGYSPEMAALTTAPGFDRVESVGDGFVVLPPEAHVGPVDLLPFTPEYMDNAMSEVRVRGVSLSLAAYGQDQRHRTVRRSSPAFTGAFYVPPILQELGAADACADLFRRYVTMLGDLPPALAQALAPYGAVVVYDKRADINALMHEQSKRLCWNAQEEIYNLSRLVRERLMAMQDRGGRLPVLDALQPPCGRGRCPEGKRFCGRDMKTVHERLVNCPPRRI